MSRRLRLLRRSAFLVALFLLGAIAIRADPVSQAVHFLATWEGFSATPYQDQGGCWTVGYGHLLTCDQDAEVDMEPVSEEDAEWWLRSTVEHILDHVRFDLGDRELRDEQYVAMVSIAYNIGQRAFDESDLLQMILDHDPPGEVVREWISWQHVNGEVNRGLSRRRVAEVGLFYFGTSHFK